MESVVSRTVREGVIDDSLEKWVDGPRAASWKFICLVFRASKDASESYVNKPIE